MTLTIKSTFKDSTITLHEGAMSVLDVVTCLMEYLGTNNVKEIKASYDVYINDYSTDYIKSLWYAHLMDEYPTTAEVLIYPKLLI